MLILFDFIIYIYLIYYLLININSSLTPAKLIIIYIL